jgi:hypothetical protein
VRERGCISTKLCAYQSPPLGQEIGGHPGGGRRHSQGVQAALRPQFIQAVRGDAMSPARAEAARAVTRRGQRLGLALHRVRQRPGDEVMTEAWHMIGSSRPLATSSLFPGAASVRMHKAAAVAQARARFLRLACLCPACHELVVPCELTRRERRVLVHIVADSSRLRHGRLDAPLIH